MRAAGGWLNCLIREGRKVGRKEAERGGGSGQTFAEEDQTNLQWAEYY